MTPNPLAGREPLLVLLVEDNEDHAELIKRSLAENRVEKRIIWVDNGEKALHYLLHQGEYHDPSTNQRPNLILLDLRLPRIDGLEVLRTIKGNPELQQIPVVILTSSAAETDIAKAYEFHANSYIVKPVDFLKFTRLMDDLGFYWLGWNQQPNCLNDTR
ncbi:MAG: response regulator [Methanoregula sp.]|nr:response regulator [Methanoregula sp.]